MWHIRTIKAARAVSKKMRSVGRDRAEASASAAAMWNEEKASLESVFMCSTSPHHFAREAFKKPVLASP